MREVRPVASGFITPFGSTHDADAQDARAHDGRRLTWRPMGTNIVSAEVTAREGRSRDAALRLQQIGFRVLHIGHTSISVEGPVGLWESTFGVQLRAHAQRGAKQRPTTNVQFYEPTGPVTVPAVLSDLVEEVAFVQPPELF
jgi:hypothetical protein